MNGRKLKERDHTHPLEDDQIILSLWLIDTAVQKLIQAVISVSSKEFILLEHVLAGGTLMRKKYRGNPYRL